jgi:hypothetical protein
VDELRAAGALDVPAAWRKSLGVERDDLPDLFSGLLDDEESCAENQSPRPGDFDENQPAGERRSG